MIWFLLTYFDFVFIKKSMKAKWEILNAGMMCNGNMNDGKGD